MSFQLQDGVWPTMITPFDNLGKIDWPVLDSLIEWYISKDVDGLFAVCQSSEMFYLSLEERVSLSRHVVTKVDGRCGVIASGHISDLIEQQIEEINRMADSGADAVVLVVNRLAEESQDSYTWIQNMDFLLGRIDPNIPLGMYECPFPYKRLLEDREIEWLADTGRFYFLKDTSCDPEIQKRRIEITKTGVLKLYNANSATLLSSVQQGYCGFCGIMGNFHPELYSVLLEKAGEYSNYAELNNFLGFSSIIEYQAYPANAKYYLSLEGIDVSANMRNPAARALAGSMKIELEQFREYSQSVIYKFIEANRDSLQD